MCNTWSLEVKSPEQLLKSLRCNQDLWCIYNACVWLPQPLCPSGLSTLGFFSPFSLLVGKRIFLKCSPLSPMLKTLACFLGMSSCTELCVHKVNHQLTYLQDWSSPLRVRLQKKGEAGPLTKNISFSAHIKLNLWHLLFGGLSLHSCSPPSCTLSGRI